jgi:hypothetical protein
MCKFGWKTCNVFDALGSLFVKYIGFVVTHLLVYENLSPQSNFLSILLFQQFLAYICCWYKLVNRQTINSNRFIESLIIPFIQIVPKMNILRVSAKKAHTEER